MRRFLGFWREDRGATVVEYALLAVGVAATISAAVYLLGDEVVSMYPRIEIFIRGR